MTPQHLTLITGASRGMGLAMAEQLIDAGHHLLCISRHHSDALDQRATERGVRCEQWPQDLARAEVAALRLEAWLAGKDAGSFATATLINNAAMVTRMAALSETAASELADALRVDLEAPLLLTSVFLRATKDWPGQRRVLNISSGLGRRAMASAALYCAAKAGMDHFTRCVALEEARQAQSRQGVLAGAGRDRYRYAGPVAQRGCIAVSRCGHLRRPEGKGPSQHAAGCRGESAGVPRAPGLRRQSRGRRAGLRRRTFDPRQTPALPAGAAMARRLVSNEHSPHGGPMSEISAAQKQKLMSDLSLVVSDAEELLKLTAGQVGDKAVDMRDRMQERIERARTSLADLQEDAVERAKDAGRVADGYVRENPWVAIGIAGGVGVLLGALLGRR